MYVHVIDYGALTPSRSQSPSPCPFCSAIILVPLLAAHLAATSESVFVSSSFL